MRVEQAIDLLILARENNVPDVPGYFTRDGSEYDYSLTPEGRLFAVHKSKDTMTHEIDLESLFRHNDWEVHFI